MRAIEERAIMLGEYIVQTGATVRKAGERFGISKSTVHKDVKERLYFVAPSLFYKVQKILYVHLKTRHLLGGEATRKRYKNKKVEMKR